MKLSHARPIFLLIDIHTFKLKVYFGGFEFILAFPLEGTAQLLLNIASEQIKCIEYFLIFRHIGRSQIEFHT